MPKIKLKRVDGINRKLVSDAYSSFMRHDFNPIYNGTLIFIVDIKPIYIVG